MKDWMDQSVVFKQPTRHLNEHKTRLEGAVGEIPFLRAEGSGGLSLPSGQPGIRSSYGQLSPAIFGHRSSAIS
jgi:hypothetical protein